MVARALGAFAVLGCILAVAPSAGVGQGVAQPNTRVGGPGLDESDRLNNRGNQLYERGLYAQAEADHRRSLAIRENLLPPQRALPVAVALINLARDYRAEGRPGDALPLDQRALEIRQRLAGLESALTATAWTQIGSDQNELNDLAAANAAFRQALAIFDRRPDTAASAHAEALDGLGNLQVRLAHYAEARPLLENSVALQQRAFGVSSREYASSLVDLAWLDLAVSRYADSETRFKVALGIDETTLGTDNPRVANVLRGLALDYRDEGRDRDAFPLLERALGILQKALGAEHPRVAGVMADMGRCLRVLHRLAEAEAILHQAVAIDEVAFGPDSDAFGGAVESLGEVYRDEGHGDLALAAFERAIKQRRALFGEDDPELAIALSNEALVYGDLRAYDREVALLREAIAISDRVLPPDHPDRATKYGRLAQAELLHGDVEAADADSRTAVGILGRHIAAESTQREASALAEQNRFRSFFLQNVTIAFVHAAGTNATGASPVTDPATVARTFATVQLAEASSAGQALAGMAARFAAQTDALGTLVRQRQDVADQAQQLDASITSAAAEPRLKRDVAAEGELRTSLAGLRGQLADLDASLARAFPAYTDLVSPEPLALAAAQQLVGADEALLVYLVGDDHTWLWVVRSNGASLRRLDLTTIQLRTEVRALRDRLDPERNPTLLPFPATRAYALYQKLLAPALPALANVHHLIVIPDGALSSFPFGVLITQPPARDPITPADHRTLAWLARDAAITVLPTIASLRALRRFASPTRASAPFLGVGDPILDGTPGAARGIAIATLFRGNGGDVAEIRKLPPLPETADELRAIAKTLGAPDADLYLRERASEPSLRAAPLATFRIIEFATHALVAGDFPGLTEPTLVLTPPAVATPNDDGLLTASKIATLKLDADWVVLSACNTAAGDGSPDAQGFSGLAKAFFYAGARALLVSNWAVPSIATVKLTTGAFAALASDPKVGRAEALRRAMVAMWDPANPPEFAHPLAWAPFSLVGEGGAGR